MCVYACIYLCSLVFIFFKSSIFKSKVKYIYMYIYIYIFIVYKIYISTRLSYLKTLHLSKLYIYNIHKFSNLLYTYITNIQDWFFQMSNTKTI